MSSLADNLDTIVLCLTAMPVAQVTGTIWWAATVTKRIEFMEKWIESNQHTLARLAAMEQRIVSLSEGIARIEHYLRQKH